jgi:hypothetical protein
MRERMGNETDTAKKRGVSFVARQGDPLKFMFDAGVDFTYTQTQVTLRP